jgi:hypothetical protein
MVIFLYHISPVFESIREKGGEKNSRVDSLVLIGERKGERRMLLWKKRKKKKA